MRQKGKKDCCYKKERRRRAGKGRGRRNEVRQEKSERDPPSAESFCLSCSCFPSLACRILSLVYICCLVCENSCLERRGAMANGERIRRNSILPETRLTQGPESGQHCERTISFLIPCVRFFCSFAQPPHHFSHSLSVDYQHFFFFFFSASRTSFKIKIYPRNQR